MIDSQALLPQKIQRDTSVLPDNVVRSISPYGRFLGLVQDMQSYVVSNVPSEQFTSVSTTQSGEKAIAGQQQRRDGGILSQARNIENHLQRHLQEKRDQESNTRVAQADQSAATESVEKDGEQNFVLTLIEAIEALQAEDSQAQYTARQSLYAEASSWDSFIQSGDFGLLAPRISPIKERNAAATTDRDSSSPTDGSSAASLSGIGSELSKTDLAISHFFRASSGVQSALEASHLENYSRLTSLTITNIPSSMYTSLGEHGDSGT